MEGRGKEGLRLTRVPIAVEAVERAEVLRYLGHHGQELSPELDGQIDTLCVRCLEISRPRASLASFAISPREERAGRGHDPAIALEGCTLRLAGHDIAHHLADATEVVLLAVTLGADVDRELRRLSLTDPASQVIFDAAATAAIEAATDAADALARTYADERGLFASTRFSPGYGDLPLDCQPDFLAALDATRQLGITLTPSQLMVPTKSVTALVGIHPTPQAPPAPSCAICSLAPHCTLRAQGRTCRGA